MPLYMIVSDSGVILRLRMPLYMIASDSGVMLRLRMPLYRTVSDRGLWKKYKHQAAPNHFHKSSYIDKTVPVVTYSQLDLGDGYRNNSRWAIIEIYM